MPSTPSKARLLGSFLFIAGAIVLAVAITGLLPRGGVVQDGDLLAQLVVSLGMLMVATFMVSSGMFFIIYGGADDRDARQELGPGAKR